MSSLQRIPDSNLLSKKVFSSRYGPPPPLPHHHGNTLPEPYSDSTSGPDPLTNDHHSYGIDPGFGWSCGSGTKPSHDTDRNFEVVITHGIKLLQDAIDNKDAAKDELASTKTKLAAACEQYQWTWNIPRRIWKMPRKNLI